MTRRHRARPAGRAPKGGVVPPGTPRPL